MIETVKMNAIITKVCSVHAQNSCHQSIQYHLQCSRHRQLQVLATPPSSNVTMTDSVCLLIQRASIHNSSLSLTTPCMIRSLQHTLLILNRPSKFICYCCLH